MSPPQALRAREIVRGVHVEEQLRRVAEAPDVGQREDTERDARVEADGAAVAGIERGLDGRPAGRAIGRAQRLEPARARALRQHGAVAGKAGGKGTEQRGRHERHVPGDAHGRGGPRHHRRVNPADCAETGTDIRDHAELRTPGGSLGVVGDEQGRLAEGLDERLDDPIEDALAADRRESLGASAESRGAAAGQNDAADRALGQ